MWVLQSVMPRAMPMALPWVSQ
jgi:hypothetical protein